MHKADIAFYAAIFFLIGVFTASIGFTILFSFVSFFLLAIIFFFRGYFSQHKSQFWLAGLSFIILAGNFYYHFHSQVERTNNLLFNQKIESQVLIVSDPQIGFTNQKFFAKFFPPLNNKILVITNPYPKFSYGDFLKIEGKIQPPDPNFSNSDNFSGVLNQPKIALLETGRGSWIKTFLFSIKNHAIITFQDNLSPDHAAFLGGITLGQRSNFSPELKEAMRLSGTNHLVALSGYNIAVIAWVITMTLGYFFSGVLLLTSTFLIISLFVVMAGAEASIVRAAIMGGIILLASYSNRPYGLRNTIAAAAFFMVLFNPKVLVFDIGFQLSFLAIFGIIYLKPKLIKFLRLNDSPGIFSWKENLLTTISVQLMVAPLILLKFSSLSLLSFLANMLILGAIPLTMTLGFLMAGFGFFSNYIAHILGLAVDLLISYELFIIETFARLDFSVIKI